MKTMQLQQKKISGKSVKLYSPFMMLTGMILSTDHFSNVTVDNGKVVEDDSRNIVLGIAMPGLKRKPGSERRYGEGYQYSGRIYSGGRCHRM